MGAYSVEKLIEVTVPDLTPVADHLVKHFRDQGYQVIAKNDSGIWDVSITKGGGFKAAAGLRTALKVEIKPLVNGTWVKASHNLSPGVAVGVVYWPALAGHAWGQVRQARLDKEAVNVIDAELQRHARVHDLPGDPVLIESAAHRRGQSGDPAGAAAAFANMLTDQLRVLGPDHPRILATRHYLAYWRGEAGDAAGAAAAFAELLPDRVRVEGPYHPGTLATRHNFASWVGRSGDPAGAARAFAELLTDQLVVLGPDHPDTLDTRHQIAHWRGQAGDPAGAAVAFAELLPDRVRVLGPDHPSSLATRNNIASWRGRAGDPAGAAAAYAELLPEMVRVLGPEDPHTVDAQHNLAYWQAESGVRQGSP